MLYKKWIILAGTLGLVLALTVWQWSTISLYITLSKYPKISTAQLQKLWDEYQASFPPQPSPDQNRFLVTAKVAEELGTIIDGWKQNPASQDVWQDAIYPLTPQLPPTTGTQTAPKFGAEETLLSQVQPLLDRYLATSSLPSTAPSPSTLGNPVDSTQDFRIQDLTKLVIVKCSHLFATDHSSEIWPLLDTNLKLASALTAHPATLFEYAVGISVRDDTLLWLGHALQAQPTLVDATLIRDAISMSKQPHATVRQVLLAELAYAIATAPDVINPVGDTDATRQTERKAIFSTIITTLDHPDAPCTPQPQDILGTCKILDKFQKYTQEDTITIAGISLLLDLLNHHQQSGHWPSALEGPSAKAFQYSLDGDGFVLKTKEEEPRIISAPLEIINANNNK